MRWFMWSLNIFNEPIHRAELPCLNAQSIITGFERVHRSGSRNYVSLRLWNYATVSDDYKYNDEKQRKYTQEYLLVVIGVFIILN